MSDKKFCRGESAPFPASEFARWTNGVVIHVVTETAGHTTDGVPATYKGTKLEGHWKVEDVEIDVAALNVADNFGPDQA